MEMDYSSFDFLTRVTAYWCLYDQRFSYYVYIPKNWKAPEQPERYNLIVAIHGAERSAEVYRNSFKQLAERTNSVVLCPLFPVNPINQKEFTSYRFLRYKGTEFDVVLNHMIDELAQWAPINAGRFLLHGFSAGGQFVHRYFYLHPGRLRALSIGAPGQVTFLDEAQKWPKGIGDFESFFGSRPDLAQLRKVPLQIIVGGKDVKFNDIGSDLSRLELNRALSRNFEDRGLDVRFDVVPDASHEGLKVLPEVTRFFEEVISQDKS